MSSMFNLSDRLKAAVNSIESTGSQLHSRAIGQNQPHSQSQASPSPSASSSALPFHNDGSSRPSSPIVTKSSAATSPLASPSIDKGTVGGTTGTGISPTKSTSHHAGGGTNNYVASPAVIAENALSGLRKSFHFGRPSLEGQRPASSTAALNLPGGSGTAAQELKDFPSPSLGSSSSRPSSPARGLLSATHTQFQLGSDPSSMSATPIPRSPRSPDQRAKSPKPPSTPSLPPPNPDDPATYPLPPSPSLTASPLPVPSPLYADPLGASPLLPPVDGIAPVLELESPTPDEIPLQTHGDVQSDLRKVDTEENGKLPEGESDRDYAKQLADAERRLEDLSKRFTNLLMQKHNADKVLRDLTPLEGGISDHEALEGWVRMMNGKVEMITEEMKRLQGKITLQESRIEELRDTHRLEGSSQTDLIAKLRSQLATAESNLASKATELMTISTLKTDLAKAQTQAKEEEEKRTKAISLLKTVRMKLVKVEKEKEEIERDRAEERAERSNAKDEVERIKAEKEREVNSLRKGFERELQAAKERHEKELSSRKATWELDMITTKAAHAKELSGKTTKVTGLEAIVTELNQTKQVQFEELQARQSEVESSRSEMEVLRNRTKELEFQLREANERYTILEDTAAASGSNHRPGRERGVSPGPARSSTTSPVEVQRLLAEAEARAEAKLSDLRNKVRSLEIERNEAEEEWATKLNERVRELEKLRRQITEKESEYAESLRTRKEKERLIEDGEEAKKNIEKEMRRLVTQVEEAKGDVAVAADAERAARDELSAVQVQISTLQSQLDDAKNHANTLKSNNRTLREELRKVQSSVQLMERQRNPGVGYWSQSAASGSTGNVASIARSGVASPMSGTEPPTPTLERKSLESNSIRTGRNSAGAGVNGTGTGTGTSSPATVSGSTVGGASDRDNKEEEEVNLEYLRNVILQFLEHKEMRPNLVRVLSVILRFTPQELRRLNSKLLS